MCPAWCVPEGVSPSLRSLSNAGGRLSGQSHPALPSLCAECRWRQASLPHSIISPDGSAPRLLHSVKGPKWLPCHFSSGSSFVFVTLMHSHHYLPTVSPSLGIGLRRELPFSFKVTLGARNLTRTCCGHPSGRRLQALPGAAPGSPGRCEPSPHPASHCNPWIPTKTPKPASPVSLGQRHLKEDGLRPAAPTWVKAENQSGGPSDPERPGAHMSLPRLLGRPEGGTHVLSGSLGGKEPPCHAPRFAYRCPGPHSGVRE